MPGRHKEWMTLFMKFAGDKAAARLGAHLLHSLTLTEPVEIPLPVKIQRFTPSQLGIMTGETAAMIRDDLRVLKVPEHHYTHKQAAMPRRTLLDLLLTLQNSTAEQCHHN
jgi:hypothetical protein